MEFNNTRIVIGGSETFYIRRKTISSTTGTLTWVNSAPDDNGDIPIELVLGRRTKYKSELIPLDKVDRPNPIYDELKNPKKVFEFVSVKSKQLDFALTAVYMLYRFDDTAFENPLFVMPTSSYIVKPAGHDDNYVVDIASRYDTQEIYELAALYSNEIVENRSFIHDGENLSTNYKVTMRHIFGDVDTSTLKRVQLLIRYYPNTTQQFDEARPEMSVIKLIRAAQSNPEIPNLIPNISAFVHVNSTILLRCDIVGFNDCYRDVMYTDEELLHHITAIYGKENYPKFLKI